MATNAASPDAVCREESRKSRDSAATRKMRAARNCLRVLALLGRPCSSVERASLCKQAKQISEVPSGVAYAETCGATTLLNWIEVGPKTCASSPTLFRRQNSQATVEFSLKNRGIQIFYPVGTTRLTRGKTAKIRTSRRFPGVNGRQIFGAPCCLTCYRRRPFDSRKRLGERLEGQT